MSERPPDPASWPSMPEPHRAFLESALTAVREDERLLALAAGGSFLTGELDEYSDLDLVVVTRREAWPAILDDRISIAERLGDLMARFTGEHVGEPRLLICLYGPPLLHVDLKFVSIADLGDRVEDPALLWDRTGEAADLIRETTAVFPEPDLQWIEDRFWVWVHYGATKIGRGELYEALGFLAFLRERVLGPMALSAAGRRPSGVRRAESLPGSLRERLRATVGGYDVGACAEALRAAVELYRELRAIAGSELGGGGARAEAEACRYLESLSS